MEKVREVKKGIELGDIYAVSNEAAFIIAIKAITHEKDFLKNKNYVELKVGRYEREVSLN